MGTLGGLCERCAGSCVAKRMGQSSVQATETQIDRHREGQKTVCFVCWGMLKRSIVAVYSIPESAGGLVMTTRTLKEHLRMTNAGFSRPMRNGSMRTRARASASSRAADSPPSLTRPGSQLPPDRNLP